MDNVIINFALQVICASFPILILIALAILGIRSKMNFAEKIQKNINDGNYKKWSEGFINRSRTGLLLMIVIASLGVTLILLEILKLLTLSKGIMLFLFLCLVCIVVLEVLFEKNMKG
jgi:hypothetical protein